MIKTSADLSNMGEYMAVVGGMLQAMEDPRYEGDFMEHLTGKVRETFMVNTIAANMRFEGNLSHVFEWGTEEGEPSDVPLFKLTRSGLRQNQMLTYQFLPSTRYVPLPNPAKYGFDPKIISNMTRHTFQLKALVMETKSSVKIKPRKAKKLFIPSMSNPNGFVMQKEPTYINPGGQSSTGAFATWWMGWFDTVAPGVIGQEVKLTEQMLADTGRKLIRYSAGTKIGNVSVGGRFASGSGVSLAFVNAKEEEVAREVKAASRALFSKKKWKDTWK